MKYFFVLVLLSTAAAADEKTIWVDDYSDNCPCDVKIITEGDRVKVDTYDQPVSPIIVPTTQGNNDE